MWYSAVLEKKTRIVNVDLYRFIAIESMIWNLWKCIGLLQYLMNKTGTAVNKVKSLLKSWQAFAGFHTEAASSGH